MHAGQWVEVILVVAGASTETFQPLLELSCAAKQPYSCTHLEKGIGHFAVMVVC